MAEFSYNYTQATQPEDLYNNIFSGLTVYPVDLFYNLATLDIEIVFDFSLTGPQIATLDAIVLSTPPKNPNDAVFNNVVASKYNKLTLTQPTNNAILTISDGKTLTVPLDAIVSNVNTGDVTVVSGSGLSIDGQVLSFSASTDVSVTGGTYSNGTAVFTNNTGGTFSVSGFSSNGTFTGGTVTGATQFTGGLTADTISATTYQNLPISIVNTNNLYSTGLVGAGFATSGLESSVFFGKNAGYSATTANYSNFIGEGAGYQAKNANSSNFFGFWAGYAATNAYYSNFIGIQAGQGSVDANNSNFFGSDAGKFANNSYESNFIGYQAGYQATNANNSNFMGSAAGNQATGASWSNFFGQNAGAGASSASASNFFGIDAGNGATNANNSNFLGNSVGYQATNANSSNFFGIETGYQATGASYSNFFGEYAGGYAKNANNSNFFGRLAGYQATGASSSNFLGYNAGRQATNASYSNFFGEDAGSYASGASQSNFFGIFAGRFATNANDSNFMGYLAGYQATNASNSNFFGKNAGAYATNASYSNLFGYNVGNAQGLGSVGSNNIIIGTNISLPSGTTNSINLGGVLFGTGTYSSIVGNPSITGQTQGKIGVNIVNPVQAFEVSGGTKLYGGLTADTIVADTIATNTIAATTYTNLPNKYLVGVDSSRLINGGVITINVDTTKFDISAGIGVIVDNHTTPGLPIVTDVSWENLTGITPTFIGSVGTTYVGITNAGDVIQFNDVLTPEEKRTNISLGWIDHPDNTNIIFAQTEPIYGNEIVSQLDDYFESLGSFVISGNNYTNASTNLTLKRTAGSIFDYGANYQIDSSSPNIITHADESPCDILYFYRGTGTTWVNDLASVTNIDPDHYDDGSGTLALVPAGKWTIQVISFYPVTGYQGNDIQYGQVLYNSLEEARIGVHDAVVLNPYNEPDLYRTFLIVAQGATNLSFNTEAEFVNAGKWGLFAIGDLGKTGVVSLDNLSDVTITSPVVDELLRYNGSIWVNGTSGQVSAGAGIIYYYDNNASGISTYETIATTPDTNAETVEPIVLNNNTLAFEQYSTTTGLNKYKLDAGVWTFNTYCYVSGGSGTTNIIYNVIKRASGGTETSLFTAMTDNITSSATTLNAIDSVQPEFTLVPSDLLVVKLSGTTTSVTDVQLNFVHSGTEHYSNIKTPLIISHNDLAGIQGGSINDYFHITLAKSIVLDNTSGVNTGDKDTYVTSGAYTNSNGTAVFTNNTGGTFNVTGFYTGFTGGIVSGLTATTISATTYQGLPTDIRVTGGTANNSAKTYTFTNNTGGTFNLSALTDLTITGGTYSSGTAVFTNNTGGTFNVTGFSTGGGSFTGGTVTGPTIFTGGLTANTFVKSGGTSAQYLMADGSTFSGTSYGFYALREANYLTTNNATLTLLGVISGLTNGTHIIESYVTANKSNVEYGVWKRTLGVTTTGNTPVIVHENADVDKVFSGFTGNTIVYTPTANNTIEIYVTGIIGNTYNWTSYSEIVDEGIATSCFTTITSNISATTITSDSISATTISATTYLNLPAASFSGGTVTGPTNFTNGLTATTISATTYLNLPASGGSFTGGTVTGATQFTGGLTGNTISATTYQGIVGNFGITVDGSGSVLTTGIKGYLVIPYNATITGWDIIGDAVGSCVFDVWKTASPTIPTVANTITGSEKPTLSSQQINSDNLLTSWSTQLFTNDVVCFNIDSASVVKRVTLTIKLIKT